MDRGETTSEAGPKLARRLRLTRAQKSEATRQRLFDAAMEIVGEHGFAAASIAAITSRADVAQGTLYNYFGSRQALFDEMLIAVSKRLYGEVSRSVRDAPDTAIDRERARLTAFFAFVRNEPHLFRILSEGTIEAPRGFRAHLEMQMASYRRALNYERRRGNLFIDDLAEIEVLVQMLISTREYLTGRFRFEDGQMVPPAPGVVDTYIKLLQGKVFR